MSHLGQGCAETEPRGAIVPGSGLVGWPEAKDGDQHDGGHQKADGEDHRDRGAGGEGERPERQDHDEGCREKGADHGHDAVALFGPVAGRGKPGKGEDLAEGDTADRDQQGGGQGKDGGAGGRGHEDRAEEEGADGDECHLPPVRGLVGADAADDRSRDGDERGEDEQHGIAAVAEAEAVDGESGEIRAEGAGDGTLQGHDKASGAQGRIAEAEGDGGHGGWLSRAAAGRKLSRGSPCRGSCGCRGRARLSGRA